VRRLALLLAALSAAACDPTPPAPSPSRGRERDPRPNFVIVVLDDLDSAALGALPGVTRRLAQEGLSFERHFVTNPLCAPSRASLLTGRYTHNHGVLSNGPPDGGFPRYRERGHEGADLAAWLHAAGYTTALLGKYLNDYPHAAGDAYIPPFWDEWHAVLEDRRADNFGFTLNENGRVHAPTEYQTDLLAARAAEFIAGASRAPGRPFFLYLAPAAPHAPSTPAARHAGLFADARAPRTPAFDEADVSDKPAWLRAQGRLTPRQVRRLDRFWRRRLQTLAAVEEMLARLFTALEQAGELDRTFVFFTSDNGYVQGPHRFPGGKNAPYEETVRVPLLVRGPGVPAGEPRAHLVSTIDYAPTLLELAGARAPDGLDGRSLVPLLRPRPPAAGSWRGALLIERGPSGDPFPIPAWRALRTPTQVYIRYAGGEREFYDLERDPHQLESVPARAPADLPARLDALGACRGPSCR
jgi:arylsulfatase A-like enzyme